MILPAVRAIVIKDDKLIVIKRIKNGRKYMVTPGGRIEVGEKPEQALLREMAEETMVEIANPRLVFVEEPKEKRFGTQHIFLCDYVLGEPQLHPDSEEVVIMSNCDDIYEPMWFPVENIPDKIYPFFSKKLGIEIVNAYKNGFPTEPKKWSA